MQYWHDIGRLKSYSLDEFGAHAERILRSEGLRGNFANLSIQEPVGEDWGDTRGDFPRHFIEYLSAQLEPQSGFMLSPDPDELLKPYQTEGYPEIAQAMENKKVKFLVGTQPDGHRVVRILLLTDPLDQGESGQENGVSRNKSRDVVLQKARVVGSVQNQIKDFSTNENIDANTCEKCGSNPGKPFVFHYGKKLLKDTIGGPDLYEEGAKNT